LTARSKARKRALDILFEGDQRGVDPVAILAERLPAADPPVPAYAAELVHGVVAHLPRIDEILASYAEGWALDRMPAVDRTILRLGAYELLWRADIPDPVAIDEAVELAKSLSTDESPRFVNGVLGRIAASRDLEVTPQTEAAADQGRGTPA